MIPSLLRYPVLRWEENDQIVIVHVRFGSQVVKVVLPSDVSHYDVVYGTVLRVDEGKSKGEHSDKEYALSLDLHADNDSLGEIGFRAPSAFFAGVEVKQGIVFTFTRKMLTLNKKDSKKHPEDI